MPFISDNKAYPLMARLEDKIAEIANPRLRQEIADEIKTLKSEKQFGLVFEVHQPEVVPLYRAKVTAKTTVAKKNGKLSEIWHVERVRDGQAELTREADAHRENVPVDSLVVVRRMGEPIYPALVPVDAVLNTDPKQAHHILIEADNYHALQLLEYLYAGKVDCIYIDPPYNTGARDWKYNNSFVDKNDKYRHSKWLSWIKKRLLIASRLLAPNGFMCVTIDDYEIHHLLCLIENPDMPLEVIGQIVIRNNPQGRSTQRGFSVNHEYALFITKRGAELAAGRLPRSSEQQARYPLTDEDGTPFFWENMRKSGSDSNRQDRPKQFYPIYWDGAKIRVPRMTWNPKLKVWEGIESPMKREAVLWPIRANGERGIEKVWKEGEESLRTNPSNYTVRELRGVLQAFRKNRLNTAGMLPATWWTGARMSATEHGTNLMAEIFGVDSFPFPKSIYAVMDCIRVCSSKRDAIILDFFAGSGTTLNAVNLMNVADGGQRQCILVTNNEVSETEAQALSTQGFQSGDEGWEKHGICRSVTWPRNKFTIMGKRDDGTHLAGNYLTGRTVTKEKPRSIRQLGFSEGCNLTSAQRKQLVALMPAVPQSKIDTSPWFLDDDISASVLWDASHAEAWLEALDEAEHVTDVYVVTQDAKLFNAIKSQVHEVLGLSTVEEEEKRPLSDGFPANLDYFKLDFLEPGEVAMGRSFAAVLPILWMMAGAKGVRPLAPDPHAHWLMPEGCTFVVLMRESRFREFLAKIEGRIDLTHAFLVTNSDSAFHDMRDDLPEHIEAVQLYKSYLDNFKINTQQV